MGSHAIMRQSKQKKIKSSGSQVFCQAVTTRMAAKFAVVRAGRYYEVGIDSYTPLMVAWHRSEPIYVFTESVCFSGDVKTQKNSKKHRKKFNKIQYQAKFNKTQYQAKLNKAQKYIWLKGPHQPGERMQRTLHILRSARYNCWT